MNSCDICGEEFDTKRAASVHESTAHCEPWHDEEKLRELYINQGKTSYEIAEIWGCDSKTVRNNLERYDISVRSCGNRPRTGVSYFCETDGYMRWMDYQRPSRGDSVPVHRLLAVAEFGIEAVKDQVVHHENRIKWDNRPANLSLTSNSEHARMHYECGDLELQPGGIGEVASHGGGVDDA